MNNKIFHKPALSVEAQLQLLSQRKLLIPNWECATQQLETVSYYRLSGYFKPFQQSCDQHFYPNTTFDQIWQIYTFDRALRLAITDALERIEIALRTTLSNHMATRYGNIWYFDEQCFSRQWYQRRGPKQERRCDYFKQEVQRICRERHEEFLRHYRRTYQYPLYPPSWMLLECLSFGKCTSLFRNIRRVQDKAVISGTFNYHPRILESCLEPLRFMRNLCAHHARVWNRWFVFTPIRSQQFTAQTKQRTLHEQLVMIDKLHQNISPGSAWKSRLYDLFEKYENDVPYELAGFSANWHEEPFWKN